MLPLRDENPTRRTPVVTILLIIVNLGVYFFVQPQAGEQAQVRTDEVRASVPADLAFNLEHAAIPCEVVHGRPLDLEEIQATFNQGDDEACRGDNEATSRRLFPGKSVLLAVVVSMFLHGSILHVLGNMLFLWIFGNNVEDRLGPVGYIALYLVGGVAATVAHIAVQPDSTVPVVGASGAIAAVMGAYLVWFPNAPILTLFFFILIWFRRVAAKWLLAFWLLSQFFIGPDDGVAWVAHVGGFVFGAVVGLLLRPLLHPDRPAEPPPPVWSPPGGQWRGWD